MRAAAGGSAFQGRCDMPSVEGWREMLEFLEGLRRASLSAGAHPVARGEGLILYTLAFTLAARFRGAVVFEAGSGVGYSTAWLLLGVEHGGGGLVYAVERSPQRAARMAEAAERLGLRHRLRVVVGDAVEAARRIGGEVHLVFIDVEKHRYVELFEALEDRVAMGGVVAAHNAWMAPSYVEHVSHREGWVTAVVPSSEGLVVSVKSGSRPTTQGPRFSHLVEG